ncbi:MAG: hypothetical protein ACTSXX_02470 [Candidatus Baldrarchaeia archaeon]
MVQVKHLLALLALAIVIAEFAVPPLVYAMEKLDTGHYGPPALYDHSGAVLGFLRSMGVALLMDDAIMWKVSVSAEGGFGGDSDGGLRLGSSVEPDWKVGDEAIGSPTIDVEGLFRNATAGVNGSGTLVIAMLVTDIEVGNTSLFQDERARIVVDEILRFAEEVGDASIILAGEKCTAMNLISILAEAERSPRVNSTVLIVLTHGILNESLGIHGMLLHGNGSPAVVNGETLEKCAELLGSPFFNKLKFVLLPFCNMGRERELFGNTSVIGFFERWSNASVVAYEGETYLDAEYIASLQSVLSSGTYRLEDELLVMPVVVVDNRTGESVRVELVVRVRDEVEEVDGAGNPYEVFDEEGGNVTLGFFWVPRRGRGRLGYKARFFVKRVSVGVVKGGRRWTKFSWHKACRRVRKHEFRHVELKLPRFMKMYGRRAKGFNFLHFRRARPVVVGSFWRPSARWYPRVTVSFGRLRSAVFFVDGIFREIYRHYYEIKEAVYGWVDGVFSSWWNVWMRGPVKSLLDATVFRGANFVITFAKLHLRSLVSLAVWLRRNGKGLRMLVGALIVVMIARLAGGILRYLSWAVDKLVEALSRVLRVDLTLVRRLLRGWIDRGIRFLNDAVAISESILRSSVSRVANELFVVFKGVWVYIKRIIDGMRSLMGDLVVDAYIRLASLLARMVSSGQVSLSTAQGVFRFADRIVSFVLNFLPLLERVRLWAKIFSVYMLTVGWVKFLSRGRARSAITMLGGVDLKEFHNYLGKMLESGDLTKKTIFSMFTDVFLVIRRGKKRLKFFDGLLSDRFISRLENLIYKNLEVKGSKRDIDYLVKISPLDGRIVELVLDIEKKKDVIRWRGEIVIVEHVYTYINGKPVTLLVAYEGHLKKWFVETPWSLAPEPGETRSKSGQSPDPSEIMTDLITGEGGKPLLETDDVVIKGFRILIGLHVDLRKRTPKVAEYLKENYGKVESEAAIREEVLRELSKAKGKGDFYVYRFDGGALGEGDAWKRKVRGIERFVLERFRVWREFVREYERKFGRKPTLFETVSQCLFELRPHRMSNGDVKCVIELCDYPFLVELCTPHTALSMVLDSVEMRVEKGKHKLESQKAAQALRRAKEMREKVDAYVRERFSLYYLHDHLYYKEALREVMSGEFNKRASVFVSWRDVYVEGVKWYKVVMMQLAKGALDDRLTECRIAAKRKTYGDEIFRACAELRVLANPGTAAILACAGDDKVYVSADRKVELPGSLVEVLRRELLARNDEDLKSKKGNVKRLLRGFFEYVKNSRSLERVINAIKNWNKDRKMEREYRQIMGGVYERLGFLSSINRYMDRVFEGKVKDAVIGPKGEDLRKGLLEKLRGVETPLKKIIFAWKPSKRDMAVVALFAVVCFAGEKLGERVYEALPDDAKRLLVAGVGEFRAYVVLSLMGFVLLNIDDYQDFVGILRGGHVSGSLKDMAKVVVEVFLGSMIVGILLKVSERCGGVIMPDDVIPWVARRIFSGNAWVFERIVWPLLNTAIQVLANGGPIVYLMGTLVGEMITRVLEAVIA